MKTCQKCLNEKTLDQFSKDKSRRDGLRWACKECISVEKAEYRARNKSRIAEYDAKYRSSESGQSRLKLYRHENKLHISSLIREWHRKHPHKYAVYERERTSYVRQATPKWTDKQSVHEIYAFAKEFRLAGFDVHVDHIVPLRGKSVCGLHCESNLRVITAQENRRKNNRHMPEYF